MNAARSRVARECAMRTAVRGAILTLGFDSAAALRRATKARRRGPGLRLAMISELVCASVRMSELRVKSVCDVGAFNLFDTKSNRAYCGR